MKIYIPNVIQPISSIFGIQKVVYRTHNTREVQIYMKYYCHDMWVKLNPKYSFVWFDSNKRFEFMKSMGDRIYNAYNNVSCGTYKTDLWRACILYKNGGIYIDSYATPFLPLSLIFWGCYNKNSKDQFICVKDKGKWGIHNGFIACTPRHPFMFQYIEDIVSNIENKYYGETDLDVTGPRCFLHSINKVLGNRKRYNYGWNIYGNLSFYLFKHSEGLYKPITKNKYIIMHKKYSLISFIIQKWLKYKLTYTYQWKNNLIYNKF